MPETFLRVLTAALIPWTLLLMAVGPDPWFPSAAVHAGWVVFDLLLAVALIALARRWRDGLAVALVAVISLDAALTAAQALTWNIPQARGPADLAVAALGVAAPSSAAALLWRARNIRRAVSR